MFEFVHQYSNLVSVADGPAHVARAYAAQQPGGLWEAWFVFFPLQGGEAITTDRETTQSKLADVHYWAGGIEPTYLEGALTRALERDLAAPLERHLASGLERSLEAEASTYRLVAEEALAQAHMAENKRRLLEEQTGERDQGGAAPR